VGKVTRAAVLAGLLTPALALAAPDWVDKISLSGTVSSDIRFNVEDYRGPIKGQGFDFAINRNDLTLHAEIAPVEQVIAVIDARLRYYGLSDVQTLPQLSNRARIDPFNVELDQAYVGIRGVPFSWLDLKVGRMVQTWGSADLFNPVDNLNARDFFDPMDYSRKVPNQMIEVNIYPSSKVTLTGVFVPTFKPSQLPPSAVLGFAIIRDKQGCLLEAPAPPLRNPADAQQLADTFGSIDPCSLNFADPEVRALMPNNGIADAQAAVRAQFRLGDLGVAASYYYGRFTFPVAYTAIANTAPSTSAPGKIDVAYVAEVMYPRMQVAGLDFSYSAEWAFDIGLVGELAVIFPEQVNFGMRAYQGSAKILEFSSVNVPSEPFIKATVGLDYTFTRWFYVNAMFVHGFFDEFNDLYGLHNYVVLAAELKFLNDDLQLRLSGILDVTDLSSVANPQLTWIIVPGVEAIAGLFLFGGHTVSKDPIDYAARSKFGQKAAGRSQAFLKVRFTW
jgi:hypothetical protein